jgi:hypothetical protein
VRWTRGPQGQVLASSEGLPPGGKTPMPADWGALLGADFRGRVRYLRRFHAPTNLDVRDSVFLTFDGVDLRGEVTLNRAALGAIDGPLAAARFDITSLLKLRNQLIVEVELPPLDVAREQELRAGRAGSPGGIVGEVRLEIVQAGPPSYSDSLQPPSDA